MADRVSGKSAERNLQRNSSLSPAEVKEMEARKSGAWASGIRAPGARIPTPILKRPRPRCGWKA